jgi:hypothetical protein
MRKRTSLNLNLFSKDSVSGHKMRRHKNKCDSNDIFIDKDGDGINDNRLKGMGLGKRKGLGKGKYKQKNK